MYLKYLQIINYKNLKSAKFEFKKGSNTIVGENDCGKSNSMNALRILLDGSYYYNEKQLKESDFYDGLEDWKGHWIIISAYLDNIVPEEMAHEGCKEIIPEKENLDFLKNYIRCRDTKYGTITLCIRPRKEIRKKLHESKNKEEFEEIRKNIKLSDYEFSYMARSQYDFTNEENYKKIVGDFENGTYVYPDDCEILGTSVNILEIWKFISISFIDALRDVEGELHKPKNPIRRIVECIKDEISAENVESLTEKINDLNKTLSEIDSISNIGNSINKKLNETIGMVYSPEIKIESKLKSDIKELAKNLSMIPANKDDISQLGLGHLNMIYVAIKLVEFEYYRERELLNIMIIEEPEAHIHTHIQKTLFENLNIDKNYTQVIMTTHSTQLSEVSNIDRLTIIKSDGNKSIVMKPTNLLDKFGKEKLELKDISLSQAIERYLDAKRSALLFSKSVILVEGDGEEILIPSLVKKILGISLDEIGVGLINIGSVAFEYIASLFDENRIKKYCSIITDLDEYLAGTEKSNINAAKLSASRKEKLESIFNSNKYVNSFFAPHTLEIDFAEEEENRKFIEEIIDLHFTMKKTIEQYKKELNEDQKSRYDAMIKLTAAVRKGWYSTLLSEKIDYTAIIPKYILEAIAFASKDMISLDIKLKMIRYSLENYDEDEKIKAIKIKLDNCIDGKQNIINEFKELLPEDMVTKFLELIEADE